MNKVKRKYSLTNSMVFAICVALLMNVICVTLIVISYRYASIQPHYYSLFVGVFVFLIVILNLLLLMGYGFPIRWMRKAFVFVGILITLIGGVATYYVHRLNTGFDRLVNITNTETVAYSLITLDENLVDNILSTSQTVGFVEGDDDFNTNVASYVEEIAGNVTQVKYENYAELLQAYLSEPADIDIAVVPTQYNHLAESMDSLYQEKLIDSALVGSFDLSLTTQGSDVKVLEEPFTVLLMGINENLADSIILAAINPQTLTITLTSLGRDSYVPIACYANNSLDKLNHAHGVSRQCLIDTVEDYMDVNVDFYFETDFYALIKIVDALGGLELTSPITFSGEYLLEEENRYQEVTIHEGTYVMTGEEVLTFARERYHFLGGDFDRQLNQQYVIRELAYAIAAKAKTNPNVLIDVLDAANNNIEMNLSMENDIAPFFGYILTIMAGSPVDIGTAFTINQTQIIGGTPYVKGVSVVTPYRESVLEARDLIKQTLGLESTDTQTHLSFSMNDPYTGYELSRYSFSSYALMYNVSTSSNDRPTQEETPTVQTPTEPETPEVETPPETDNSFEVVTLTSGYTLEEARAWAASNGITLIVNSIDENSDSYRDVYIDGQIIYQSVDPGMVPTKPESITISVIQLSSTE